MGDGVQDGAGPYCARAAGEGLPWADRSRRRARSQTFSSIAARKLVGDGGDFSDDWAIRQRRLPTIMQPGRCGGAV